MTNGSGNGNHPQNRHPYLFYWLTAGLATIVAAIIGISAMHSSAGSVSNPEPSDGAPSSNPTTSQEIDSPAPVPSSQPPSQPSPTAIATPHTMLLSTALSLTGALDSMDYVSVDGAGGYSKPGSVSLRCGYETTLSGLESDPYKTFKAQLVPFPIPVEERVIVRYEILVNDRVMFVEDVSSGGQGRSVAISLKGARTLTLHAQCTGEGPSGLSADSSWAGFDNAYFS
jgi:hypothetical protein